MTALDSFIAMLVDVVDPIGDPHRGESDHPKNFKK